MYVWGANIFWRVQDGRRLTRDIPKLRLVIAVLKEEKNTRKFVSLKQGFEPFVKDLWQI